MSFLANMTFPRAVILLSFLGSAGLAYFDFELSTKLDTLRNQEKVLAPQRVRAIQQKAGTLSTLAAQANDDPLIGQTNPGSYVRQIAQDNNVRLGQVDVNPAGQDSISDSVIDVRWSIKPVTKDRGWSKEKIGNFMFLLESKSEQVKVTRVKIEPPSGVKVKPEDIPRDEYTFEVGITSRQRE